jgi:protein phosphatase
MDTKPLLQTTLLPSAGSPRHSLTATRLQLAPYWEGVGISETGTQRTDNQDGIRMTAVETNGRPGALFAIADGMGGFLHGRFASQVGLQVFLESCLRNPCAKPEHALRRAVEEAHFGIQQAMQKLGISHMGTTLTAAWLRGTRVHLVHVGDSRAYLIRDGEIRCLTQDHSTAGEMYRMRILSADKVRSHPRRSELTRGLGLGLFIQPDILRFESRPGDRLVLCTDGVWSALEDEEIAGLSVKSSSLQEFGRGFVDLAMERGSDDNVSALGIQIDSLPPTEAEAGFLARLAGVRNRFFGRSGSPLPPSGKSEKSAEMRML